MMAICGGGVRSDGITEGLKGGGKRGAPYIQGISNQNRIASKMVLRKSNE
jgi:hypothetical protein